MQWPAVSTTSGAINVPVQAAAGAITATASGHLPAGASVPPTTGEIDGDRGNGADDGADDRPGDGADARDDASASAAVDDNETSVTMLRIRDMPRPPATRLPAARDCDLAPLPRRRARISDDASAARTVRPDAQFSQNR